MKLAFYKAEYGNWLDKIIAWWTRPNFFKFWESAEFSHVEMHFTTGTSFSSSPRDGGTRWKDIDYDEKWEQVEVIVKDEELIKSLCTREEGKKYDWACIFFSFLFPFEIEDHSRWICSEICGKMTKNLRKAHKYHPQKLYNLVSK